MDDLIWFAFSTKEFSSRPEIQSLYLASLAQQILSGKKPDASDAHKLSIVSTYLSVLANEIIRSKITALTEKPEKENPQEGATT